MCIGKSHIHYIQVMTTYTSHTHVHNRCTRPFKKTKPRLFRNVWNVATEEGTYQRVTVLCVTRDLLYGLSVAAVNGNFRFGLVIVHTKFAFKHPILFFMHTAIHCHTQTYTPTCMCSHEYVDAQASLRHSHSDFDSVGLPGVLLPLLVFP